MSSAVRVLGFVSALIASIAGLGSAVGWSNSHLPAIAPYLVGLAILIAACFWLYRLLGRIPAHADSAATYALLTWFAGALLGGLGAVGLTNLTSAHTAGWISAYVFVAIAL